MRDGFRLTCPGDCGLGGKPIQPTRPKDILLMIIGEAPGKDEVQSRAFFVGKAGQEMSNYLMRAGLSRDVAYITNVLKCRTNEQNRDPKKSEIEACSMILLQEIMDISPRFIVTAGRFSTQWVLGPVDMEQVHGIPFTVDEVYAAGYPFPLARPATVVPVYHPALGLHDSTNMSLIMADFFAIKGTILGKVTPRGISEPERRHLYRVWGGEEWNVDRPVLRDVIALDTETQDERDTPWSVQFSSEPGIAYFVKHSSKDLLSHINCHVNQPQVTTVLHNALFDLPVLADMGIFPARYVDTMVMAYLLQTEPQGLKQLAFRHLGIKMQSYQEVTHPTTRKMAIEYLSRVLEYEWPDPDPAFTMVGDNLKIRRPQNMSTKVGHILTDLEKDPDLDLPGRWNLIEEEEGRGMVESFLGPLRRAFLKDIPFGEALEYACRDADVTLALYPLLSSKIATMELGGVLGRDMRMLPMAADMQHNGMKIDKDRLREISLDFGRRMDDLHRDIRLMTGKDDINPGSDPQVFQLLRDLRVEKRAKLYRGATDHARLEQIAASHPVIERVVRWRGYRKLKSGFLDVLPEMAGEDGRIRTTIRITRVVTGRLSSSNPNLMAQPVRTEDGRQIRGGFVSEPGFMLVSGDYCLGPGTRVLTLDLRWIPIESLKEGDLLWGVDEDREMRGGTRKMRLSVVEKVGRRVAESSLLITKDGKHIVASNNHPWLSSNKHTARDGTYKWKETKDLNSNCKVWNALDVWDSDDSWESGYIAGAFDGEGSISVGRGIILAFTQKPGLVLDHVVTLLKKHSYDFHAPWVGKVGGFAGSSGVASIWISNRRDIARFLGTHRPIRLLDKAIMLFEGRRPPMSESEVEQVIPLGITEVVSLQTSTRTFIAEGLISHNSQVEMRGVAHMSEDPVMMDIFWGDKDIHSETASRMFNLPIKDLDEMKHRYPAKRVGFGILNLISARKLLRELEVGGATGWTEESCQRMIYDWFSVYSGVADWIEEQKAHARRYGFVRDFWGRIRLVPELMSVHRAVVEAGLRQAVNAPIQMGAQGIIKEAMGQLVPLYRPFGGMVKPLLQIHDDLLWEIKEDLIPIVIPIMKDVMENCAPEMTVPLKVDFKVGHRWNEMKKWEED